MHNFPVPAPAPASNPEYLSDSALVASASAGDTLSFECIMRRHNRLLFRTARSILKNDAETEDALQEAYLRAWRALKTFRADAKLSTWLVRIVINESLGRLRRTGAQIIPLDGSADMVEPKLEASSEDNPDQQPDSLAMRAQVRRLIEARIDLLPDIYRTVFMLRAVEELNVEETSAALGVDPATVRTRFFELAACCVKDCRAMSIWLLATRFHLPVNVVTVSWPTSR